MDNVDKVAHPEDMNEAFARAFNSRQMAALLALYEDEAVLRVDTDGPVHQGKAAIAKELQRLLAAPGSMGSTNNFCLQQGAIALLRADWELRRPDGSTLASGSSAEVVRRQPDGRWLYVIDHASGADSPRHATI